MARTDGARPTLASVAALAGVSRQTVSNVLNEPARVQEQTLARVRAVLDEVGYRPHLAARQLRTRRSNVIGLRLEPVTDGINGAVLDRFLHALTEGAQARGYRVVLFTADDDTGEIARYRELLDTTDIDAFVLTGTHHGDARTAWLTERDIPFVTFGRPWTTDGAHDDPSHAWVDVDGCAGTRAATEHLLEAGHRRVAFAGWPVGSGTGDERRLGWRSALEAASVDAGAADSSELDHQTPDGVAEGARVVEQLLRLEDPPTALVCASDSLALGALEASRAHGVPLAVVGFDDTPVAAAVGLSSIAQPLVDVAEATLERLVAQLGGTATPATPALLHPRLVVRRSSTPGPPR